MGYASPEKRREAKRRYTASQKAKEARQRRYRDKHPLPYRVIFEPLVAALSTWRN